MEEKKRNAKGEGSFKINSDGSITYRKTCGYKMDGKRKVLTVTQATKTACIREMKKKEAIWEKQKERDVVRGKNTVEELCFKHLEYQIDGKELKNKSIDRRESTIINQIGKYPIGKMQIQTVTSIDIENHIMGLIKSGDLSSSSIKKTLDVLNAAYKWAYNRKDVEENPVVQIKESLVKRIQNIKNKAAEEADVMVLSDEEIVLFEKEACMVDRNTGKRKYASGLYGELLLHTGMRCGEMLALRWKHFDAANRLLTIEMNRTMIKNRDKKNLNDNNYVMAEGTTKNQKAGVIQLKPEACEILKNIWEESTNHGADDFIVTTKTGRPNTTTNMEHRMAVIYKNAGLPETVSGLHILRRTFATQMYEAGARVKEIAAYIGDLESTTEKYYIAIRKKARVGGVVKQVVPLPAYFLGNSG